MWLTSICCGADAIFLPFLSITTADTLVWPIARPLTRKVAVSFSENSDRGLPKQSQRSDAKILLVLRIKKTVCKSLESCFHSLQRNNWWCSLQLQIHVEEIFGEEGPLVVVQNPNIGFDGLSYLHLKHSNTSVCFLSADTTGNLRANHWMIHAFLPFSCTQRRAGQ